MLSEPVWKLAEVQPKRFRPRTPIRSKAKVFRSPVTKSDLRTKANRIEIPAGSLRTCLLAALMLGGDGFHVNSIRALSQEVGSGISVAPSRGLSNPVTPEVSKVEVVAPFKQESMVGDNGLIPTPADYPAENHLPGSNYPYPSAPSVVSVPHFDQAGLISGDDENIRLLEPEDLQPKKLDLYDLSLSRYTSYRSRENAISYMPGDGNQFGWLSFASPNYLRRGTPRGITANMNIHLLSGPLAVPLPPRLYDFELGYQVRNSISDLFSYEWAAMVGVYSDFEDSARDGVRFPAHAVGMFHPGPRADWVFGVDYLGRDDIKVLPVAGFVWHDPDRPELRYEMIFPRPRIDLTLTTHSRIYCSGLLGGGTWDIEFPDDSNDVMTYRDYKVAFGLEQADSDGDLSSWELGWVFGRKLEFRNRPDDYSFGDAFVIRYVTRH